MRSAELTGQNGFGFSKSKGQNFLIDANIPEKIVRLSGIDKSFCVLEVGPGMGALTERLCMAAGRVVAVELDGRLLPILHDVFAGTHNVEFIQGDILKLDIKKLAEEKMLGVRRCVCANLPYNITTPAITTLIEAGVFDMITVMVQREVARRICAEPGSSDYGAFSVFVKYYAEAQILFDVPPECFKPRPKVFSSVVMIKTGSGKILTPDEQAVFFRVVRAAFGQRRKTLVNALYAAFGQSVCKEEMVEIVKRCGFNVQVRGETLDVDEFMSVARELMQGLGTRG